MTKSKEKNDYLNSLYTMGTILLLVTGLPLVLMLLNTMLFGVRFEVEPGAYAIGSMMMSGFVTMLYVSYRTYRKAVTGSAERRRKPRKYY